MFRWLLFILIVSCQCEPGPFTPGQFACRSDGDCIGDYRCVEGVCRLETPSETRDSGGGDASERFDAGVGSTEDAGPADGSVDGGLADAGATDGGRAPDGGLSTDSGVTRDAGMMDAGSTTLTRFCPSGYCWVSPLPHGNALRSVAALSDSDVWTLSANGHLSHWNGTRWDRLEQVPMASTNAVWMSSSGTVYVVGTSLARMDLNGWQTLHTPPGGLNAVWGIDDSQVWVVGLNGFIGFWNGTTLASQTSGTVERLRAIRGLSRQDVWAVGDRGLILKFNGTTWAQQASETTNQLLSIVALPSHVFVGGDRVLLRWTGMAWMNVALPLPEMTVAAAAAEGTNVVLFSGFTRRGLIQVNGNFVDDPSFPLDGVFGADSCGTNCLIGVGHEGRIVFRRNLVWSSPSDPLRFETNDVHGTGPNNVWTVGRVVGRFDGTKWAPLGTQPTGFTRLTGLYVLSSSTVFSVGFAAEGGLIYFWNGASWILQQQQLPEPLTAIHGTGMNNLWAVGGVSATAGTPARGAIMRFDGTNWTRLPAVAPSNLQAVAVRSATEVWVAGESAYLARWDGTMLTPVTVANLSPTAVIRDLESEPTRITAVGFVHGNPATCIVLEKNGSSPWTLLVSVPNFQCNAIAAIDGKRWVATSQGVAELTNNTLMNPPVRFTAESMTGIYLGAPNDVWVVGTSAAILHKTP